METLIIHNLPEDVAQYLKTVAQSKGHSMEQEVREWIISQYTARQTILERIKKRWNPEHPVTAEEIDMWINTGRP